LPEDKWTVVENTHEAIISKEIFKVAQSIVEKRSRPTVRKQQTPPSILAGYLVCGDCHSIMQRTTSTHKGKKYRHMICSTYKKLGKTACTNHLVSENNIREALLETINKLIDAIIDVEQAIKDNNRYEIAKIRAKLKNELRSLNAERKRIMTFKSGLYTDYKQEVISLDDYKDMRQQFETQQTVLDTKIDRLNNDLRKLDGDAFSTEAVGAFVKYKGISRITREILGDLVDRIIVNKDKSIKIIFKFQDEQKRYMD